MTFIKMLIGLPLLAILLIFAFVNNDLATFNLWPFYIEVTVSLSVAIVFLFVLGFLFGNFFCWLSYVPELISQKRANKKLHKAKSKLSEEVETLQENLKNIKKEEVGEQTPGLKSKIKNIFKHERTK